MNRCHKVALGLVLNHVITDHWSSTNPIKLFNLLNKHVKEYLTEVLFNQLFCFLKHHDFMTHGGQLTYYVVVQNADCSGPATTAEFRKCATNKKERTHFIIFFIFLILFPSFSLCQCFAPLPLSWGPHSRWGRDGFDS